MDRMLGSLMLLCFGCMTLAYLVAIDRATWFHLRPVSGAAQAMSNASHARDNEAGRIVSGNTARNS